MFVEAKRFRYRLLKTLTKTLSTLLVFCGLLFGRATEAKRPSVPKRIAAVQKALQHLPPSQHPVVTLLTQWGNWGNWNNWNNWANWANWNNWNNWGNWRNY